MDKSIVLLLVFSFILSGISYYLGYRRPAKIFSWLAKTCFVSVTFLLIPVLAVVLFFQSTAKGRLSDTGFVPYPKITESVGIAFGIGENPIWIFKIKGKSKIENFYLDEANRPGWTLVDNRKNMMTFKKNGKTMQISTQSGWTSRSVIYMMGENSNEN